MKALAKPLCIGRFGVSVLVSKADKFDEKLKKMKAASELVDREVQTRGTVVIQPIGSLLCRNILVNKRLSHPQKYASPPTDDALGRDN